MSRDIFKKRVEYKPFEYPEVQQFIDAMNKTFWVHSEVNFDADVQDFKTKLKPHEQECIKRNALAIAQVEVAVKPFWGDIHKVLPKPEFNNLGATFAESEIRHGEAYARLIEVMGYNDEFKKLLEVPVFKRKLELFEKHFGPDIDFVDKLLFFAIVIENSSLFSQFANILAFSRFRGAMKNIANMINWSAVDENCLDLRDTKILTPKGWRMIKDVQVGDEVFGFKEGKIRLERVLKTIKKKLGDAKLYDFSSAYSGVTMTENHDVIYRQNETWKKSPLRDINRSSINKIPVTGVYESDNQIELTDWDRLRIAAQVDGSLRKNKNKAGETYYIGQNNGKNLIFGLKRERKVSRLRDLLNRLGVEYSESKEDSRGYYHFKLNYDLATNPFPKNFDWVDISKVNRKYAEEFIEEVSHWDGSVSNDGMIIYSTNNLSDAEKVQALGILAGYVTKLAPNQKKGYAPTYRVNLTSKDTGEVILRSHTKKLIEDASPDLEVGCVTVPSGGIIVKRGNKRPMITGNCHATGALFILNQIFLEHPEMRKSQEDVEEIIKDYIAYESELLDWIFEEGEFEWYTKEDVVNFMKFRVDTALEQMGYNKIYNITPEQYSKMKRYFLESLMISLLNDLQHILSMISRLMQRAYSKH